MPFVYKTIQRSEMTSDLKQILSAVYEINDLDIEDVFTDTQLSKYERRDNYMYVSLQFPEFDKDLKRVVAKELHCFVGAKFLLIINKHDFRQFQKFDEFKKDEVLEENQKSVFAFYEILDFIVTRLFRALRKFKIEVENLENRLNDDLTHDLITEIQIVKRNLINFISLISPLQDLIYDLQIHYNKFLQNNEDGVSNVELLDDSLDKVKRMLNNLRNYSQQVTIIGETNEALIARNTNQVIKLMTAVSIFALVPSGLAGFFGMNIYMGWDPAEKDFRPLILAIVLMGTMMGGAIYYFKKHKWI